MTIGPGSRLGPYEIVSQIGAGGMGEVWKARDTRLDRSVAIKVLANDLAGNAELKLRFEREARSISQLGHPHICTLYDIGEENGTSYLVMELLEGETLADRIARGPLPLEDVIRYGRQIAEALDRAHRGGIVHRDLKPGNVMITRSGAKLLDFGLARSSGGTISGDAQTVQKDITQEGTILGTFQYMAPEQLEGIEADARTDIFALGAVLYEMTTGRRAFSGRTRTSLIAAIVASQPPPIRTLQPLAPSSLDHVIATCLQKDPENRWQSARDVANELEWIAGSDTATSRPAAGRTRVWQIAAVALALIAAAAGIMALRDRSKPPAPVAFEILPPPGQNFIEAAIAPSGSLIAYTTVDAGTIVSQASLWVRPIGEIKPVRLASGDGFVSPFWSPDSKWIAWFDGGRLLRISVDGGQPEIVTKLDGYGVSGAWSKSGVILFAPKSGAGFYRVPAAGGDAVPVTTLDAGARETLHGFAQFLSDDDHFLYLRRTIAEAPNEIYAGSLSGNLKKPVVKADATAGVWKGWLLLVRNGALYAQRFDEKSLSVTGEPRKILDELTYFEDVASAAVSVANDGGIVYAPSSNLKHNVELAWYDDSGKLIEKLFDEKGLRMLALSADESKVAMPVYDSRKGAKDLYVRDIARGVVTRVTGGLSNNVRPVWAPDGARVFFASDRDGMYGIYSQSDDGVSPTQVIWKGDGDKFPQSISPDGSTLLSSLYSAKAKDGIWIVPLNGDKPRPLIVTDGDVGGAQFSPDGTWIVYQSNRSGLNETYVMAWPEGRSYQVSTDGGAGSEWNYDGKRVIFQSHSALYSVDVVRNGKTATIGKPVLMFAMPKMMTGWWRSKKSNRSLCAMVSDPRDTVSILRYVKGWADALR